MRHQVLPTDYPQGCLLCIKCSLYAFAFNLHSGSIQFLPPALFTHNSITGYASGLGLPPNAWGRREAATRNSKKAGPTTAGKELHLHNKSRTLLPKQTLIRFGKRMSINICELYFVKILFYFHFWNICFIRPLIINFQLSPFFAWLSYVLIIFI